MVKALDQDRETNSIFRVVLSYKLFIFDGGYTLGKVILICDKIGSGKYKLAKQINIVNNSKDIMLDLFGAELYYSEPKNMKNIDQKLKIM